MISIALAMSVVVLMLLASVAHRLYDEKNILRNDNRELEKVNRDLRSTLDDTLAAAGRSANALNSILVECHGIIGACVDDADQIHEQEAALTAILTECHATLGNDVSGVFGTLDLSERKHYTGWQYDDRKHRAGWSSLSTLQAKHATEKKQRKEENEPGFGKFTIDEEPFEPCDVVYAEQRHLTRKDVDSSEQKFI